jgi:hypothetical protein
MNYCSCVLLILKSNKDSNKDEEFAVEDWRRIIPHPVI